MSCLHANAGYMYKLTWKDSFLVTLSGVGTLISSSIFPVTWIGVLYGLLTNWETLAMYRVNKLFFGYALIPARKLEGYFQDMDDYIMVSRCPS